ncbi:UNVERIFIED_CONTAM: hypothetical protein HDU68_011698 [Siphonaria sp. JEL0065]|nr:hypothetical protein HDU68_011698 [Siphonaria sp. JEL0065]
MVAGDTGIGKSNDFIHSISPEFNAFQEDQLSTLNSPSINEIKASTISSNSLQFGESPDNITFVDTPGLGSFMDCMMVIRPVMEYISSQFSPTNKLFSPQTTSSQLINLLKSGTGVHSHVDICLYCILHRLKPVDLEFMRLLSGHVTVVPVIVKGDTMKMNQVFELKRSILENISRSNISIYGFGLSEEELLEAAKMGVPGAVPFVVCGNSAGSSSMDCLNETELLRRGLLSNNVQDIRHLSAESTKGPVSWSPNTTKIRMVLNYKKILFETTWLSFADIAANHQSLQITPNLAGPIYTCPAILDNATAIQDSLPIAKYLNATYPSPSIFPSHGGLSVSLLVQNILNTRLYSHAIKLIVPKVPNILDERGVEYFQRTRLARFGVPLNELCPDPEAEWKGIEKEIRLLSDLLVANQAEGPFFTGSVPCYGDFCFVGFLVWFIQCLPADATVNKNLSCYKVKRSESPNPTQDFPKAVAMKTETDAFGRNVYMNFGCTILDCNKNRAELALPVNIGNDVWIGGHAIILPGATTGDGLKVSVMKEDTEKRAIASNILFGIAGAVCSYGITRLSTSLSVMTTNLFWMTNGFHTALYLSNRSLAFQGCLSIVFLVAMFSGLMAQLPLQMAIYLAPLHLAESIVIASIVLSLDKSFNSSFKKSLVILLAASFVSNFLASIGRSLLVYFVGAPSTSQQLLQLSFLNTWLLDWSSSLPGLLILTPVFLKLKPLSLTTPLSSFYKPLKNLSEAKLCHIIPILASCSIIILGYVFKMLVGPQQSALLLVYISFAFVTTSAIYGRGASFVNLVCLLTNLFFNFVGPQTAMISLPTNISEGHLPVLFFHSILQIIANVIVFILMTAQQAERLAKREILEASRKYGLEVANLREENEKLVADEAVKLRYLTHVCKRIKGSLDLMKDTTSGRPPDKDPLLAEALIREQNSLQGVVEDVGFYSMLESGIIYLDPRKHRLVDLVSETIVAARAVLKTRGLDASRFHSQVNLMAESIMFDLDVFQRIVLNSILFAFPDPEYISVIVNKVREDEVSKVHHEETYEGVTCLEILISHRGSNISSCDASKVFKPFAITTTLNIETAPETATTTTNTGLEMSIAKSLVEKVGGTTAVRWVQTKGNGGGGTCTIQIKFPIFEVADNDDTESAYSYRNSVSSMPRSSVPHQLKSDYLPSVDSNSFIHSPKKPFNNYEIVQAGDGLEAVKAASEILVKLLEREGKFQEIVEVSNGLDAVKMCMLKKFSVVFMDLEMPGMNGDEATARIRASGNNVPIIAVTGNLVRAEDLNPLRAVGVTQTLTKPVSRQMIQSICNKILGELGGGVDACGAGNAGDEKRKESIATLVGRE